jgi:hypothetical protein
METIMKIKAFNNFRSDAKIEEEGKWADIAPGVQFKIRRLRSKLVMDARRRIYGPHERAMNGKDLPDATETMCTIALLSQSVIADWRGEAMIDDDTGQPVPFSVENCAAVVGHPETGKDLRGIVITFANDSEFYAPEDTAADLGNSPVSLSGS